MNKPEMRADERLIHHTVSVLENRPLSERYYLLVLARPERFPDPGPGSFIHLLVPDGGRFFLRRPFSIMDCDDRTISLLIVEKGLGTQIMRRWEGEMDLVGPLGSVFPRLPGKRVLALGGGVGLAPLYFYGAHLQSGDVESFRLLYGARNRADLFVDNFDWNLPNVQFASDDASHGFGGTVVELARKEIERAPADVIFSCGPNPMLRAAQEFARSSGLPHYVSLENRMACAVGACRSCVILTREGEDVRYQTVCSDGPVFGSDKIVWEQLPDA